MKFLFAACIVLITIDVYSQEKIMSITVDDLPDVIYGNNDPDLSQEITNGLISTFLKYEVPAIGYVNERKLYSDGRLLESKVKLLEQWVVNGLELGNHSFSHMNYHQVSFEEYTADIIRGEGVIRDLMESHGLELQFFRHPYLRIGLRESHADSLTHFLQEKGYIVAPVSIDNTDYLFAQAYGKAHLNEDTKLMRRIGDAYVSYMEEKLLFYETSAEKLFDRSIAQILLVHASLLNAHYIDELVRMYIAHGYTFVSQAEALKDKAYDSEITRYGDWGISWIDRWALSQGVDSGFFSGDPLTPEWILSVAN